MDQDGSQTGDSCPKDVQKDIAQVSLLQFADHVEQKCDQ